MLRNFFGMVAFCFALGPIFAFHSAAIASSSRPGAVEKPITVVVDLAAQRATAYRGAEAVFSSPISSGRRGHRTPKGVFGIIQKRPRHYSNLYNGAPMPYMQRLTWSGIALHAGHIPGYPASHGCIRLPHSKARQLFSMTSMNHRVIVTDGSPKPSVISHPLLWDRLPPGVPTLPPLPESLEVGNADTGTEGAASETLAESAGAGSAAAAVHRAAFDVSSGNGSTQVAAQSEVSVTVPALASLDPNEVPATRAALARRDELQIAQLRSRLAATMAETEAIKAELVVLADELRAANLGVRELKENLRDVLLVRKKLETARVTAEDTLHAFLTKHAEVASTDPRFGELAEQERVLAEAIASTLDEMEAVERDHGAALAEVEAAEGKAKAAAEAMVDGKKRLAQAGQSAVKISAEIDALEQQIKMREKPVHILVSRETSKIHIRLGYKEIFVAPAEFIDPKAPIGTHVYQPISEADDGATLQWMALTVPDAKYSADVNAQEALNRVVLSKDVHRKVVELIKVGSSLIVSDRGPSNETGKGTDFIILTR